jgi:hypothetical protein
VGLQEITAYQDKRHLVSVRSCCGGPGKLGGIGRGARARRKDEGECGEDGSGEGGAHGAVEMKGRQRGWGPWHWHQLTGVNGSGGFLFHGCGRLVGWLRRQGRSGSGSYALVDLALLKP